MKPIESEGRTVVARGLECGGNREILAKEYRVSFIEDEYILES